MRTHLDPPACVDCILRAKLPDRYINMLRSFSLSDAQEIAQ
jgi:hypothetical protein